MVKNPYLSAYVIEKNNSYFNKTIIYFMIHSNRTVTLDYADDYIIDKQILHHTNC